MSETPLFPDADDSGTPPRPRPDPEPPAPPRLRLADRQQVRLVPMALDELIPADHDARFVWNLVSGWDLSKFLDAIRARGECRGGPRRTRGF